MRIRARAATLVILIGVAIGTGANGCNGSECNCPSPIAPIEPTFQCPLASAPKLKLDGPCEQVGTTTSDGILLPIIGGTGAGTCHASFILANGATYSSEVAFAGQSIACGNDPRGCGEAFEPSASVWTIDNACEDSGQVHAVADASSVSDSWPEAAPGADAVSESDAGPGLDSNLGQDAGDASCGPGMGTVVVTGVSSSLGSDESCSCNCFPMADASVECSPSFGVPACVPAGNYTLSCECDLDEDATPFNMCSGDTTFSVTEATTTQVGGDVDCPG